MIGIKAMEFFIPGQFYPVSELTEIKNLSTLERQAFDLLQLEMVTIDEHYDDVGLSVEAAKLAITKANLTPTDLDVIIYLQSRTPAYLLSSEAAKVQHLVGAKKAFSLTVTDLGCANISGALYLAWSLLKANPLMQNILICSGSKPAGPKRYRENVTVLADAGMGIILSHTTENQILDIKLRTDGKFWDLYKLDYKNCFYHDFKENCTNAQYKFALSVATRNVFSELNQMILQENKLSKVAGYIMQNLSISAFFVNEDTFNFKYANSCYHNCKKYGHFGGIDIILNYKTSLENGEFKKDDIILIMNNSPTACWSSMLVQV